ncbi:UvrD-helicase domain-containing protein [Nitratireductor sp. GCM10026969]|uniref:UvrD-helicase domain-containing protein n=1 Tax=Nitratireductor sp. GCM10026969 TaxID=3252645 RepID=UPI0036112ADD
MTEQSTLSPAEEASEKALAAVREAIEKGISFKLEAGAGAGKTYSLIKALQFLIERQGKRLPRLNQRIACITFTNVAKAQIELRTDRSPVIHCDTIHGFCWSVISSFQSHLRAHLPELEAWAGDPWADRLHEHGGVGTRTIEYTLGYRGISDDAVSLHHNDILPLTIKLLGYEKFRNIFRYRYPIMLIDEYQDTNADWVATLREHFFGKDGPPLFGFFGDHWQKIYGDGCGELSDETITEIGKEANFRSVKPIVDCLNRMRPELKQFVVDPKAPGEVHVFHTNGWTGQRLSGPHYGGDLPEEQANHALSEVKARLVDCGWDLSSDKTKILMLTHRSLGKQQGYGSLPSVFQDKSAFTKKEQAHIAFFVDHLEPACRAFVEKRYGEMFAALGANKSYLLEAGDKKRWSGSMTRLMELRETGTVSDVVKHLRDSQIPRLGDSAEKLELRLEAFDPSAGEDMPRSLRELEKLHEIPYQEIVSVTNYLEGYSPFETKHGVKGAEFENVLVVVGRGWNKYNFGKMLENVPGQNTLNEKERKGFEDNRNLFYVACSRPKVRLALLFTQELSNGALETISGWFGGENIAAIY